MSSYFLALWVHPEKDPPVASEESKLQSVLAVFLSFYKVPLRSEPKCIELRLLMWHWVHLERHSAAGSPRESAGLSSQAPFQSLFLH